MAEIRYNPRVLSVRPIAARRANESQLTSSSSVNVPVAPALWWCPVVRITWPAPAGGGLQGTQKCQLGGTIVFNNMETREMCFEAKRLCKLALGPVLMLMSVVALALGRGEPGQYVAWCHRGGQEHLRPAHDHSRHLYGYRRRRFRGDVLLHHLPSQIEGRCHAAPFTRAPRWKSPGRWCPSLS